MNTEDTIYDQNANVGSSDEKTEYSSKVEEPVQPAAQVAGGKWKKVVVSGVSGIVFGTAASLFTSAVSHGEDSPVHPEPEPNPGPEPLPIVDEHVSMATCVDDDMSFSQAFAAARAEVGAGGVFEWHGNLYSTYTAEEWDHMSASEQAEYNEHFAWAADTASDEAQVVGHETEQFADYVQPEDGEPDYPAEDVHVDTPEAEVEVLGVVHDDESGANIGMALVDDQEVYFIDVDDDQQFDYMATDANNDTVFSDDEVVDISDQNLTADDLGGYVNSDAGLYAANEEGVDYLNGDMPYDC